MDNNDVDQIPPIATIRAFCRNEDRGEMICVGVILPVFEGDDIEFLCECTKCGALEIFPVPFPMAYPVNMGDFNDDN